MFQQYWEVEKSKRMKKILFTIQWYGVDATISRSPNTLCDENIINELKKDPSLEIHTLSYAVDGFPLEEFKEGVYIHRFRRSWLWRQLINCARSENHRLYRLLHFFQRVMMRIKQILNIPIYPIYEPLHIMNFAKNACKLHQKENFDMVISVHNGTDSLCAGYYVKRKFPNIQYVSISWDSIAGGNVVGYLPSKYARLKKKKFEQKIAEKADAMIVMEASRNFYTDKSFSASYFKKLIFLDVPYFCPISVSDESNVQIVGSPLKVLFSGNMVGRNPMYLFQLFEKYPTPVIFTFICHSKYHSRLLQLSDGLSNVIVKCVPYMEHKDLQKLQLGNDILINFGVKNPNAISGKIFDYMSTGKAILSTTTIDNEACIKYLNRYPRGLIIDERIPINRNIEILMNFVERIAKKQTSFSEINELFYTSRPEAYKKTIEKILGIDNVK